MLRCISENVLSRLGGGRVMAVWTSSHHIGISARVVVVYFDDKKPGEVASIMATSKPLRASWNRGHLAWRRNNLGGILAVSMYLFD